jgi:hypothetical protein
MITYTKDNKEAIITSAIDNQWTVSVYESFEHFITCQTPIETKTFNGTPNRTQMLQSWPDWTPKVRDPNTWEVLPDSTDDLPLLSAIPKNVSARQIRLWLVQHGFQLSQIETAIDNIEDPMTREIVRIEWEYAPYIERNHAWLVPLAQSLGLNEEQIDQAFREASAI